MSDFKAVYDRVLQAQADRDVIMNEIETAMAEGTPEGDEKALALRETLDGAQKKVVDLETMYTNMQAVAKAGKIAAQFVPVSSTTTETAIQEEQAEKVMALAAYNQLSPRERLAFAKRGGKIEDKE
jgi:hypothetical protein